MIIFAWSLNRNNLLFVPAQSEAEKKGVLFLGSKFLILLSLGLASVLFSLKQNKDYWLLTSLLL